jgi:hypothetical protein
MVNLHQAVPKTAMMDAPADTSRKLREVLVEQRRKAADEAARLLHADLQAALQKIATVLAFQDQIEGIDRVILDEDDMESESGTS